MRPYGWAHEYNHDFPPVLCAACRSVRHCGRQNDRQHYAGHVSLAIHVCSNWRAALQGAHFLNWFFKFTFTIDFLNWFLNVLILWKISLPVTQGKFFRCTDPSKMTEPECKWVLGCVWNYFQKYQIRSIHSDGQGVREWFVVFFTQRHVRFIRGRWHHQTDGEDTRMGTKWIPFRRRRQSHVDALHRLNVRRMARVSDRDGRTILLACLLLNTSLFFFKLCT